MNGESNNKAAEDPTDARSVETILSSSMKDLEAHHKAAHDLLVERARKGFFEEHQTNKDVKKLATELLESLEEGEDKDEG